MSQNNNEQPFEEEVVKSDNDPDVSSQMPDLDSQEEVEVFEAEGELEKEATDAIQTLTAEKEALEERVLRLQAEIANMQRINAKERQDAAKYRSQKLASEMVDVLDNLERALATPTSSDDAQALKKGVEMVYEQVKVAFEKENILVIDPIDQEFDPNFHQAVSVMPAEQDQGPDKVVQVLQKGYQLHDRVLRPAMVIVTQ